MKTELHIQFCRTVKSDVYFFFILNKEYLRKDINKNIIYIFDKEYNDWTIFLDMRTNELDNLFNVWNTYKYGAKRTLRFLRHPNSKDWEEIENED